MFLPEWREFPSAPCFAGKKKNLMTDRVSMLLKWRASLTCFRVVSFLVGLRTYEHSGMFMICLCEKDSLVLVLELLDPEDEGIMFFRNQHGVTPDKT